MFHELPCIREEEGTFRVAMHDAIVEAPVSLIVNGRNLMTAMISPDSLEEFVIGFLFTEQIIATIDDIESIRKDKDSVSVLTKNPFKVLGQKRIILSGCGGISSFLDARRLPKINSTFAVAPEAIRSALKEVTASNLHQGKGGVHRVGLVLREGPPHIEEDIGTHHALDKVIGYSLKHGLSLGESYVISSGKITSEMVRKCLVARIPLIVSAEATTTLAVEIAEQTGLCVAGFTQEGIMNIYTHPHHILGALPMKD